MREKPDSIEGLQDLKGRYKLLQDIINSNKTFQTYPFVHRMNTVAVELILHLSQSEGIRHTLDTDGVKMTVEQKRGHLFFQCMSSPGPEQLFLSLLFADGYYIEIDMMSNVTVQRFSIQTRGSEDG